MHRVSIADASTILGRGYNIGVRLIEDFLARTQQARCYDLKETADVLAKVRTNCLITSGSRSEGLGSDPMPAELILT